MTAFDTGTNTSGVTFTDSYATGVFTPSLNTWDSAWGFTRTDKKRYFEFVVNDGGNTIQKPGLGVFTPGFPITNGTYYGGIPVVGQSITTGDVFMFAVNQTGDGLHPQTSVSYDLGGSTAICAIGKNGAWLPGQSAVWLMTGSGALGVAPFTYRGATSLSDAAIRLRVLDAEYQYKPTGYEEWGNSGGVVTTTNTAVVGTWAWDPITKSANFSLSGSNHFATFTTITSGDCVFSQLPIPTDRKSVWEISTPYAGYTAHATRIGLQKANAFSFSGDTQFRLGIGAFIANVVTSASATGTAWIWGGGADNTATAGKRWQFVRNPAIESVWVRRADDYMLSFSDAVLYATTGGSPLMSISVSQTLYVFADVINVGTESVSAVPIAYIFNPGNVSGFFWPMYPGFESLDRTRRVFGGDTYWQLPSAVTSVSVAEEISVKMLAQQIVRVSANKSFATGKKYFEINTGHVTSGGQTEGCYIFGLSTNGGASYTQTGSGALDSMLGLAWFSGVPNYRLRNGPTVTNWTITTAQIAGYAMKALIAVDFDAGKIWFGRGGEAAYWGSDGDPATGANPALTFAVNTPLYPAVAFASPSSGIVEFFAVAAFEAAAQRFPAPTGFGGYSVPNVTSTITATITPSTAGTGSLSGSGHGFISWPFGINP